MLLPGGRPRVRRYSGRPVSQLPASSVTGIGAEPRRGNRLELAAGVVVAAASVAVLCWVGADTWFRTDAWDFLLRRPPRSLDSWLRPHGGHLQVPAVGLHRLLYAAFGLDFWPWYYLPHLVGYAALMFYMWRVMLRRGADRFVAFAVYLVLLFLGVSYFLASIAVGSLIVLALLLWVAQRIDAGGAPSLGQGVLLAAALVVMVSSSSEGVAALAACGIVVLASPAAGGGACCPPACCTSPGTPPTGSSPRREGSTGVRWAACRREGCASWARWSPGFSGCRGIPWPTGWWWLSGSASPSGGWCGGECCGVSTPSWRARRRCTC